MKQSDLFVKQEPVIGAALADPLQWRKKYEAHIRSAKWKNMRRDLFRMRGKKCEECGKISPNLEVHHLTYDRLGNELPRDLKIVCRQCHVEEDKKRAAAAESKRKACRLSNAFDTWFHKRTGMHSSYAIEGDWDNFERWLGRKNAEYYE